MIDSVDHMLQIEDISIAVTLKNVKNVRITVCPPDGRVTVVAPSSTQLETIRNCIISNLRQIRTKQTEFANQARESPRQFINLESHKLWGNHYLLDVVYKDVKPHVKIDHTQIILTVRPGSDCKKRAAVFQDWHKSLLQQEIPPLIKKWQNKLGVKISSHSFQYMKTMWGNCNPTTKHIRLNTELVKKPIELVEYIIVHELAHLIEPNHSKHFDKILDGHYPSWRKAKAELNRLPISG